MPDDDGTSDPRALLAELYLAGVRAAAAGPALRSALAELDRIERPVWILALGKAALPMASAAAEFLAERGRRPEGGLIVAPLASPPPHPALEVVAGDHPEPGPRSLAAARRLGDFVARVRSGDEAWVLLSGGATSLTAAPVDGIPPGELTELFALLLRSGLEIGAMNAVRKRFVRWGAGRLAAALAPARVRCYVVSDVVGDDLGSIGSGPCVPDDRTAAVVRSLLASASLWERLPPSVRASLEAAERHPARETPKPGDPVFGRVRTSVVAGNRLALAAAADRARALGLEPTVADEPLTGEAAEVGRRVGRILRRYCRAVSSQPERPRCLIWGGETTVTLGEEPAGTGGRCQELALAAARELASRPGGGGAALLAAGTDGRDGPTDAAGAIVEGGTWEAVRRRGRDPARDLARHDSHAALEAAGALFRPGATGTNVMDVVIGLCAPVR